jgi:predicted extracellular nuclease
MTRKTLLSIFSILIFSCSQAQDYKHPDAARNDNGIRVMFYNVENLFDTINDPTINDEEYLPESQTEWVSWKYFDKTNKLAQVIANVGGFELPGIVGVCEIENRLVLENLAKAAPIEKGNYKIVHYDSPDRRGIDVGLLYRPEKFRLLYSKPLHLNLANDTNFRTRDILYVKGVVLDTDTLHLFVNHWPSRSGGQEGSEPKRIAAAALLKQTVDSIFNKHPAAQILIMGDLNDTPKDKSVFEVLGASNNAVSNGQLTNLMYELDPQMGTHKYRGEWAYLDQIIVSKSLKVGPLQLKAPGATVFRAAFLLEEDTRYTGDFPFRAFRGPRYIGGFSDHLPVFVDLIKTDISKSNQNIKK